MEAEVELKYEIRESKLIEKFLSNGEVKSTKNSVDKYYDNKDFSFFKQGIVIRVRDDKKLDFKYNFEDDKHEYCQENRFELPLRMEKSDSFNKLLKTLGLCPLGDDISLPAFLKLNNLIEFVIIDKTRTEISKSGLNFYFDDVKELGEFIEIEGIPKQSSDIKGMIANIEGIAKKLNLKKLTTGYVELYLRKYDYSIYKQGKYLLEEDAIGY
jgi:predicted adenylyl cyclase CyaB